VKLYFWVKLTRVTGKVGAMSPSGWRPMLATDAQATGIFNDTVEGVYFQTVLPSFTEHQIREKFQTEVSFLAIECGFHSYQVVTISESEYYALQRNYAEARLEAMGVTKRAIEAIKAGDHIVVSNVYIASAGEEFAEIDQLIEQLTSGRKVQP
jgi:hypothetical protein